MLLMYLKDEVGEVQTFRVELGFEYIYQQQEGPKPYSITIREVSDGTKES